MAGNKSLVAQLTTTFSRQRQRRTTPTLSLVPQQSRYIHTPPTPPAKESFYEEGFTLVEPSISFLEPESEEYRRVVLPPRERSPFSAAWPTILAHPHSSNNATPHAPHAPVTYLARSTTAAQSRTARTKTPCQAVHQLIRVEKDLASAHRLIDELTQLGIPILPHRAYLDAAIYQARRRGVHSAIKTQIISWLRRWYAFPPSKQFRHTHVIALEPLLEIIMERWATDFPFLRELMLLGAERGWAPAVIPVLFRHYTICVGPVESLQLLNEMASLYTTKTPDLAPVRGSRTPGSQGGETPEQRGERRTSNVVAQVTKWRNLHLRTVLQGDQFVEEAKMIFQAGEEAGVVWDRATKKALVEALQARVQVPRDQAQDTFDEEASLPSYPSSTTTTTAPTTPTINELTIPQQTIRIAHARSRQPVRNLADLLHILEQEGRYTLISRLEKRFIRRPPPFTDKTTTSGATAAFRRPRTGGELARYANETTAAFWWMAHMVRMRRQGRHVDVLELFRARFYPVGLPLERIKVSSAGSPAADEVGHDVDADTATMINAKRTIKDRKLYPFREIIAAVLPSLIHLTNPTTPHALAALHTEFLRSLPAIGSSTTTDPVLHLPFILFSARNFGAKAAEQWCTRLEENQGIKVGVQGWSVVAVEYAKTRKMADIEGILDRMQRRSDTASLAATTNGTMASEATLIVDHTEARDASSQPNERTFMGIATALLKRKKYYKAKAVLQRWHEEQERRKGAAALVGSTAAGQDL
ncbi:hypothetical protein QFC22_004766 [Naganishia vaughanmartiniae]|uniref:Uncharacterized protein n=1 Tax=Naganishia vaughanmartiniae TaxID=1424756 RepID=A0ACC2WYW0_9TREE|nr:hypothetical protein QFC22_004766 [Naganishia vaughanmartiniae]